MNLFVKHGNKNSFFYAAGIAIIGLIFFIPFLGAVHLFDWDEINFAESAREMLITGNYTRVQINFQPFWEKPPLFFWLQALSMRTFGINEFAARFPNAVTGVATLLTFFFIGKSLYDSEFGMWWALCMLGSFLPHLYFKSGIIDPVFNYFIFLGIYFTILSIHKKQKGKAILSGIFIGLATLTKGPVALLIWILVMMVYWISLRLKKIISFRQLLYFALSFLIVAGIWFAADIADNGFGFLKQFVIYQFQLFSEPVAGHSEPIYYHFVIVFFGCFPMSVIALPALVKNYRQSSPLDFKRWMLILFWVVLILFTIVKTKIVHYSSLSYFPLSFLAAFIICEKRQAQQKWGGWLLWILSIVLILTGVTLFLVPWLAQHQDLLTQYINDPFAKASLQTPVRWSGYEQGIAIAYLACALYAIYLMKKNRLSGIAMLFLSTAVCIFFYLKAVVPKIEEYSQGPAIKFYQSLQGQAVYVNPVGFYSYAQYFYFRKQPGNDTMSNHLDWLLTGNIDRPAYFVVKKTDTSRMQPYNDIHFLYSEGGFAFYERKARSN